MRARVTIPFVVSILLLGCRGSASEPVSPFMFFERPDMRAGVQYSVMEAAAKRESIGQFNCTPLWSGGKRCQVAIDPGMLIATVNGKGRVVHLKIGTPANMRGPQYDPRTEAVVDYSKAEFSRMREAWGVVSQPEVTAPARGSATYHWVDDQSRWTAGMWYGALYYYLPKSWQQDMGKYQDTLAYLPDSVVTIDEFAYEDYMKLQPADFGGRTATKGPPTDPLERLQFDLSMVAGGQREYFEDHATYATSPDALIFLAGDGVHVEITGATKAGWAATATHDRLPGMKCVLYSGTVEAKPTTPRGVTPAVDQIACDSASE